MTEKQFLEIKELLNRLIRAVDGVSTAIITRDPQTPKGDEHDCLPNDFTVGYGGTIADKPFLGTALLRRHGGDD